jgi:hypothetical protein
MSNNNEENLKTHSEIYYKTVRKLRAENAEKEKIIAAWKADKGSKPPLESLINSPVKSEEEVSRIATEAAIEFNKQEAKRENHGLVEKPKKNSLEAFFDGDKEAAKKLQEKQQNKIDKNRAREQVNAKSRDQGRERDLES